MKYKIWILAGLLVIMPFPARAADYDPQTGARGTVILQTETMINGQPIHYQDAERPHVTAMIVDIAPGGQTGWHSHAMPVYAYLLTGQLTVKVEDGKTMELKEGNAFVEVVKLKHNGINNGKTPVKLVVFYLGEKGTPIVTWPDKP